MSKDLNQEKARVFRITHIANLPWILKNGIQCANSARQDPNFQAIGNADLIGKRKTRSVPEPYGGRLSDYVPFYFTPFSMMMYNIHTGYNGIAHQKNEDIIFLVSSIHKFHEGGQPFVCSDRHAYLATARFFHCPEDLDQIDWDILQRRDFKRDPDDPEKVERYQAEALAHGHVPVEMLLGIACYDRPTQARIAAQIEGSGAGLRVIAQPNWYFT